MMVIKYAGLLCLSLSWFLSMAQSKKKVDKPNVIIIYADDLGYGDLSCYGATKIKTPHIDQLAREGIKFTNAYATSATCTPSRYSLLTGEYAWRKPNTQIADGDASLIIDTSKPTMATMFQRSGYTTAVIGKWHLGLGGQGGPDWNGEIKPGPRELGFDYSFIIPATGDRVPCVYIENRHVVNLDKNDPLLVNYKEKVGNEPTGSENPELLKMKWVYKHDNTIINGISRIGFMAGGKKARWVDEEMAEVLTDKAKTFIIQNQKQPFFLYFSTHDIHVPRVPSPAFAGKTGLGPRGDVILQLDWSVGQIQKLLDSLQITQNTIIIFSSDNGPVLNDGYADDAVEKLNGHTPSGILRGGKYSAFEAGTRVPLIISWKGKLQPAISQAQVSQIDFYASLAAMNKQTLLPAEAPDSYNRLNVFMGSSDSSREFIVEHAGVLAIIKDNWKYITPGKGPAISNNNKIELGNSEQPQLYNLKDDPSEKINLADKYPEKCKELSSFLQKIKSKN